MPGPLAAPPCSVTLLDRLKGDQHYSSEADMEVYDARPGELVLQYIKNELGAGEQKRKPRKSAFAAFADRARAARNQV